MNDTGLFPGARFDLVVLAASAGGLPTLLRVIKTFTPRFPAALLFIQHMAGGRHSLMPEILNHKTDLPIRQIEDGDIIRAGCMYVMPPGQHLTLESHGAFALQSTPPLLFLRPSIDLLLESVALVLRERVLVVILSGMGADGSSGILAVKRLGGIVIAEEPGSALFASMPSAAVESGQVDFILPVDEIGPKIVELIHTDGKR